MTTRDSELIPDDQESIDQAALEQRGRERPVFTRLGAIGLLVLAIVCTVLAAQLPFGSFDRPAVGTWPLMVSIAFMFFSAISIFAPELDAEALDTPRREVVWFAVALAICSLFGFLFWLTGYFLSTAVFVYTIATVFARPKWWVAALVALGAGLGIWLLFDMVLQLPAP